MFRRSTFTLPVQTAFVPDFRVVSWYFSNPMA